MYLKEKVLNEVELTSAKPIFEQNLAFEKRKISFWRKKTLNVEAKTKEKSSLLLNISSKMFKRE